MGIENLELELNKFWKWLSRHHSSHTENPNNVVNLVVAIGQQVLDITTKIVQNRSYQNEQLAQELKAEGKKLLHHIEKAIKHPEETGPKLTQALTSLQKILYTVFQALRDAYKSISEESKVPHGNKQQDVIHLAGDRHAKDNPMSSNRGVHRLNIPKRSS